MLIVSYHTLCSWLIVSAILIGVQDVRQDLGFMHNFCTGVRAYHMTGLPPMAAGVRPTFLQLYIYDANELDDRLHLDAAKDLSRDTVDRLQRMLHAHNPFVQFFKAIDMSQFGPNVNIILQSDVGEPTYFSVIVQSLPSSCPQIWLCNKLFTACSIFALFVVVVILAMQYGVLLQCAFLLCLQRRWMLGCTTHPLLTTLQQSILAILMTSLPITAAKTALSMTLC